VSGLGLPVRLVLTPGQAGDPGQVPTLLDGLSPAVVIADRGYDTDAVVGRVEAAGAEAVIPSHARRSIGRAFDRERYKDRNVAERFWAQAKRYRRVATRYDKKAQNFLAFVHVASIMILLR
jgi:transposase